MLRRCTATRQWIGYAAVVIWLGWSGAAALLPQSKWSVESVLKQESLTDANISPDGRKVVWVKRFPDKEKDRYRSDLFLTLLPSPPDSGRPETIRLTRTGDNYHPRWSPDGRWIAFLSSRQSNNEDKKTNGAQIWLLDLRGGEPRRLAQWETGVQRFAWLDSTTLVFSAREGKTYYEQELKKHKDDAVVVEDTTLFWPVRLFTLNIEKGNEVRRLTHNRYRIGEFAPDPTGRYIVYSLHLSPITADARMQPRQYLLDRHTGKTVEIFPGKYFDPENFQWTPDGRGFYATDEFSSDPENEGAGITELYYFDVATGAHQKVPLNWEWGVGFGGYAVAKNGVHVQLADGPWMKPRFYRKTAQGWAPVEVADRRLRHSTSVTIGPDGETMVFVYSRPDSIPRYYHARYQEGRLERVGEMVQLNGYLKKLPMPRAEVIRWVGAEGDTVNGILYYPLNYRPGRRHPLMVVIHGGPSGADLDAWRLSWTVYPGIWAEKGAFVFRPNYHGSGNHGLKFVESIKGRYYELEVPDIVRGVQHLIDRGMVHPDSLGVMGWSNGAILTIALTVEHPEMFKAAAPGAGDVNWISDYGNCSFGVSFDNSYFKGPPWEHLQHYIEKSPLFRMHRVVTPTIIFFGTEDRAVPTEQGWEHYRALQQLGKAPVRFILFPGQPHGLQRLSHQRRKMEEEIAWFDRYLFGKASLKEQLEARVLPKDSPLALLERRARIKMQGRLYGEKVRGVLAPEVIAIGDSLWIGRFEVTRAQFREFRASYKVAPGTENYPANNITLKDARRYVAWLSRKTGRKYRLPTEKELKSLRRLAGASENNLSYWLGYTPTVDEQARIRPRVAGISPDRLLMPVGSRPPGNVNDEEGELIFDVDGNVAEWAETGDGKGRIMTGSAITVEDSRATQPTPPPLPFVGFRVVLHRVLE